MEQPPWNQQLAFPPYGYQYKPYPFYPPMQQMQAPPYWLGKRQHHSNKDKDTEPEKRGHMSDADYYDSLEQETFNKQLLNAVNKQTSLLEKTFDKLNELLNKKKITTTEDWNYIEPYLKHEASEHDSEDLSKKDLDYYGDD